MGTIKQNQDLETTWMIDASNNTYILGKNAEISTSGDSAIRVTSGSNNNDLILKGDVKASDALNVINVQGNNTHIAVAQSSFVDGRDVSTAINSSSANLSLENAGRIEAQSLGLSIGDFSTVTNTGSIIADTAIFTGDGFALTNSGKIDGEVYGLLSGSDGTVIKNLEGGQIIADTNAIYLFDGGDAMIKNSGLIMAQNAITDGDGDSVIVNKGIIAGDVNLGEGNDVFNTRAGKFEGTVNGGDGNDIYIVGKSSTDIAEQPGFGKDVVKTTVSFTISENIEELFLQGKKDIDGTGNTGNNTITGNKGDNVLNGMTGEDYLIGGKGDDTLFGGAGEDMFDFRKGTGNDVVEDFVNGEDVIYTPFAADEADLLANHLIQKNGGVLLSYGEDSLFIKGVTLAELDESDFFTI